MNDKTRPVFCSECGAALQNGDFGCSCLRPGETDSPANSGDVLFSPHEEDEMLFAPEEIANAAAETGVEITTSAEPGLSESRPIYLEGTFIQKGPVETAPSLQTMVNARPVTQDLRAEGASRSAPIAGWLRTLLLAIVAGSAGGLVVYMSGPSSTPVPLSQGSANKAAETDIVSTGIFVNRNADTAVSELPADERIAGDPAAAEQRPIPAGQIPAPRRDGQISPEPRQAEEPEAEHASTPDTSGDTSGDAAGNSEKEAKVGGMVIEKTGSRRPRARCADGTYSYAAGSAACAQRGGVSELIEDGRPIKPAARPNVAYVLGPRGGCYFLNSAGQKVYVEKKFCN